MKQTKYLVVFLAIVLLTGCTTTAFMGLEPASNFEYPNSNVVTVGQVRGSASKSGIGSCFPDGNVEQEAIQNALAQKPGTDILINYTKIMSMTMIWFFCSIELTVEGTAAKMEIGAQRLK